MELYQIRYFLAVSETLNFTRAAERCFVSQPALTKAIQRLEDAIGGRLLDRTRNSVQLTELGRAMLPNFRQIYDTATRVREEARRLTRQQELVRVGIMCTIHFDLVLPRFVHCHEHHPMLELSFHEGSMEALTDALDQGDLDMCIMCSPYEFPKRFRTWPLFAERYVVAIGDDHRFLGRDAVKLEELNREHYCERTLCEFSSYIDRLLAERNVDVEVVQQTPREDWIQSLVRANFGISFMPESVARAAGLNFVHLTDCAIERVVRAMTLADRPLSAAQQSVVDTLAGQDWSEPLPLTDS